MRLETQTIHTPDGIELFVRTYHPKKFDPARTLYWVHGLGEHGGRHEHLAQVLADRGWRMIIADLRGHGRSTGIRTHVRSFHEYVDDIAHVWTQMELNTGRTVLLGHSMGGLIAARTAQSQLIAPSSLILSSPLLGLKLRVNPVTLMLGTLLVRVVPTARFSNGIDPRNMTHDPEFSTLRRNDPYINKTVTASWYFAMRDAMSAAQAHAENVSLPVLALQGTLDRTTDPDAMADWWLRIRSQEKSMIVLEDHFHELFFEPDWRETIQKTIDWLDLRVQSLSISASSST
ncbi:alpha/beta fold hydrolase [Schlesneria paludicola]|uniref:alpha/beta fold hydrolase n=1 Tax=Schlesneria paludicola TaxID=360056 RepID=UPI000299E364|nr:alpha/beta fold hydrolase [Schlesneria paludicola]